MIGARDRDIGYWSIFKLKCNEWMPHCYHRSASRAVEWLFRLDNSSYCQIRERWSLVLHQFRRSCALVWWIWVGHSGMCRVLMCVVNICYFPVKSQRRNVIQTSSNSETSCCCLPYPCRVFAFLRTALVSRLPSHGTAMMVPERQRARISRMKKHTEFQNNIQHHTILGNVVRSLPHLILETSHCEWNDCWMFFLNTTSASKSGLLKRHTLGLSISSHHTTSGFQSLISNPSQGDF